MQRLKGISVCDGIVMGPVVIWKNNQCHVECTTIDDIDGEISVFKQAAEKAKSQLQKLYDKAMNETGEEGAAIFEVHKLLLEDEAYLNAIYELIQDEHVNAAYAVSKISDRFAENFAAMEDTYIKERGTDIREISKRLIDNLLGQDDEKILISKNGIIIAEELSADTIMQMHKEDILALVITRGSVNSHASILARMMGIPTLVQIPIKIMDIKNGIMAIVDGIKGELILEPDKDTCMKYNNKIQDAVEESKRLETLKGKENTTKSGQKISLCANVTGIREIENALEQDAEGIGLFRSEFLYLGRKDFPSEEEQYHVYKEVAERMEGKKLVIRTIDMGGDKKAAYLNIEDEINPALGCRGIRICLKHPEILRTQLRALFRASVYGNISIMYPMITSVEEVRKIYAIAEMVESELTEQGIAYKRPMQGVMIETPAAVMISEELAGLVDFFSIGTNDLTQYTLAVDRQNHQLTEYYHPHHKAILKMIQMVVDNGHKYGKKVAICGELAADTTLTKEFIRMGVDELSVVPSEILKVRKVIREIEM